ncbi:MAG: hypothetical protein MPK62_14270, partial [Alphaproteobacteria bacterium]|nr:hypothetical protein [Alphaproteobacteria bacterium]
DVYKRQYADGWRRLRGCLRRPADGKDSRGVSFSSLPECVKSLRTPPHPAFGSCGAASGAENAALRGAKRAAPNLPRAIRREKDNP